MFFLSKGSQKETFFDILDRKECFLDLKSEVLKKSRELEFGKGVCSWVFLKKKSTFFLIVFFEQREPERNIF